MIVVRVPFGSILNTHSVVSYPLENISEHFSSAELSAKARAGKKKAKARSSKTSGLTSSLFVPVVGWGGGALYVKSFKISPKIDPLFRVL
jgi:hypothetical protein